MIFFILVSEQDDASSAKLFEFSFDFLKPIDNPDYDDTPSELQSIQNNNNSHSLTSSNVVSELSKELPYSKLLDDLSNQNTFIPYDVYVRKCCNEGEAFLISIGSCTAYSAEFLVPTFITSQNRYVNLTRDKVSSLQNNNLFVYLL